MKRMLQVLIGLSLLSGCASGMKYAEVKSKLPTIKDGEGRIFVYRPSGLGFAIKPDVYLNPGDEVIGNSQGKGFFVVDKPAGQYDCSAHTEVKRSLSFALAAGETKYVRSYMTMGFVAGHLNFELVDQSKAEEELKDCSFTGTLPAAGPAEPAKPATPNT